LNFNLPGAHYKACFVQGASVQSAPPSARCKYAAWRTTPSLTLGKAHLFRGQLTLPLTVTSTLAGVSASLTLAQPAAHCTPGCSASEQVFYRRRIKLAAHQTLVLPDRKLELLTITTPRTSNGDYLFSARTVLRTLNG
jgi:hypothetical protein